MGCHTWYFIPKHTGIDNVRKHILERIEITKQKDYWDNECEQELTTLLPDLDSLDFDSDIWWCYLDTNEFFSIVNNIPGIYIKYPDDPDEPRIGGYPDNIITSAEEMFEFMRTGFTRDDGLHFDFFIKDEDLIKKHIETFFNLHPDGIIEFG